jgi:hypothetical protein
LRLGRNLGSLFGRYLEYLADPTSQSILDPVNLSYVFDVLLCLGGVAEHIFFIGLQFRNLDFKRGSDTWRAEAGGLIAHRRRGPPRPDFAA